MAHTARRAVAVASPQSSASRHTLTGVVVVLLVATAAATVAADPAALGGGSEALDAAAPFTTVVGALVRALGMLAAIGVVGTLVVALVVLPGAGPTIPPDARPLLGAARRWAVVWVIASLASGLLALAQVSGEPVLDVLRGRGGEAVALIGQQLRGVLFTAWFAALVVMYARGLQTRAGGYVVLVLAVSGLMPPVFTGHSGTTGAFVVAVGSGGLHVLAATVWVGGLLALAVHAGGPTRRDVAVVRRYSTVALACFVAVVLSGVLNALTRLSPAELVSSGAYGAILLLKVISLMALGGIGLQHRRRTIRELHEGRPARFWALVSAELVVMATAVGLGVVLSSTAF